MPPRFVHVVAAAISNSNGEYLIALRHPDAHQGDKWEFPGGKVEQGEPIEQALSRELDEELGIRPVTTRPLIRIRHHYSDKSVLLDVWRVTRFEGEPHGREGQPLAWVSPERLAGYEFPQANYPIVTALMLPERYLITPEPQDGAEAFLEGLERALEAGIRLVQFRAKGLCDSAYRLLAEQVVALCHGYGARVLLNADASMLREVEADGIHLTSERLRRARHRPVSHDYLLSASCHDPGEIELANRLGIDFAVISPVKSTASHPEARPLGWERFAHLAEQAQMPVYALGGVGPDDLQTVQNKGGQGIAAIRALWAGAKA